MVPTELDNPYDMAKLVAAIVDDGELYEYSARWAPNLLCAFARIDGHPVGVVANQPAVLAGALDIDSAEKGARFVRTCDAFNVPLVTFVDVPGFLPLTDQELGGIIRFGSKLLYAFIEATVPRIQVVVRKAYGGAYVVMNSKALGADLALAWASAEIAVMAPEGAVEVMFHRELDEANEAGPGRRESLRAAMAAQYVADNANPYLAAEHGYVDAVIDPADTRPALVKGLEMLRSKRYDNPGRKHGNVPL